jgi:hypothetical protein
MRGNTILDMGQEVSSQDAEILFDNNILIMKSQEVFRTNESS